MKAFAAAALLAAAISLFGQNAAKTPGSNAEPIPSRLLPDQDWQSKRLPPPSQPPNLSPDFKKFLPALPEPWNNAGIDPQIIRRPPPSSIGVQPPGIPVAKHLYPNLRFQPVDEAQLEPIPIDWLRFKVEEIPVEWPKLTLPPVTTDSPAAK